MAKAKIPKNPDRQITTFRNKEVQVFDDIYADADAEAPYGRKKDNTPYTKHHNNTPERIQLQAWKEHNGHEQLLVAGNVSTIDPEAKAEAKRLYETSDLSVQQIGDETDINKHTIDTWVKREHWCRKSDYSPIKGWWTGPSVKTNVEQLRLDQQEAIKTVLTGVAEGAPLKRALKQANRTMSTFQHWKQTVDGFEEAFDRALQYCADSWFSDGIDILDSTIDAEIPDEERIGYKHAKAVSDQKLKAAGILAPLRYSEKARLDVTSADEKLELNPVFNIIGVPSQEQQQ